MAKERQPEWHDKFWHEGIGSGQIIRVNERDRMVTVDFYEKGIRTYEFDELLGNWSEDYRGTWLIYNI